MGRLGPVPLPLRLHRGPESNSQDHDIKNNGGQQSWDVQCHVEETSLSCQTETLNRRVHSTTVLGGACRESEAWKKTNKKNQNVIIRTSSVSYNN